MYSSTPEKEKTKSSHNDLRYTYLSKFPYDCFWSNFFPHMCTNISHISNTPHSSGWNIEWSKLHSKTTSADCSSFWKMLCSCHVKGVATLWQQDGTNADRSCGNLRSVWNRVLWLSDWLRSSPLLARFPPNNCFEICRYIMRPIMTVIITLLTELCQDTAALLTKLHLLRCLI